MKTFLDTNSLENAVSAVFDILENAGVRFEDEKAREVFLSHGADVKEDIVYIPRHVAEEALQSAPKQDYTQPGVKRIAAATPFSNAPFLVDDLTGKIRRCNVEDAIRFYQINETADLYECANPGCADPEGIETEDSFVAQIAMMLKYSAKYPSVGLRATGSNAKNGDVYQSARRALRLIRAFYDVWDEPVMTQGICPNPPLAYDKECLDNLKAAIDEKQAISLFPCSVSFMTGPERIMDLALHDFAMALAGVCYIQFLSPGHDVALSEFSTSSDLSTLQPVYGCAESVDLQIIFYEITRYFDLPCSVCGCYGDGTAADYQAGMEAMLTMLQPFAQTEVDEVWCYPGHLSGFSCGSFRKAIFDEEAIRLANRTLRQSDMSISPDISDKLNLGRTAGSFLTVGSMENYRSDQYITKIFDKGGVSQAMTRGRVSLEETADRIIAERVAAYGPPKLIAAQKKLLDPFLPSVCR